MIVPRGPDCESRLVEADGAVALPLAGQGILPMSKSAQAVWLRLRPLGRPGFQLLMVYLGVAAVVASVLGCWLTATQVPNAASLALGAGIALTAILPLLFYIGTAGKRYLRDAAFTILWVIFCSFILGFPVTVASRLGMGINLQDARFVQWDHWLGINVPAIAGWASHHWLGNIANKSYAWLFPFMQVAIFLPILAGELKYTQKFVLANMMSFFLGIPVFAMFPAIGPWFGYHLAARPDQAACQALIFLMRTPGPYVYQYPAGAICFPSFHVVWAILCVQALWWVRPLRIPVSAFCGLIIFSTMTVDNHYFCDVLAGIALAAAALVLTNRLVDWNAPDAGSPSRSGPSKTETISLPAGEAIV